jgi:phosphoribosylformylglycinamidine synthase
VIVFEDTGELLPDETIRLPISHGEGRYYADDFVLDELEATGRVVLRYADSGDAGERDKSRVVGYLAAALVA